MENFAKQSLRIAPNSKVEEINENAILGAPKRFDGGGRMNSARQSICGAPDLMVEDV